MGRLYIANCTKQNREIQYHLHLKVDGGRLVSTDPTPINRMAARQTILPGRQEIVASPDLPPWQIESIIRQLTPHGLVGKDELYSPAFRGQIIPMVYSLDRPVSRDVIMYVMDNNAGQLTEEGRQRRVSAAVATNELVVNAVAQTLAQNNIEADVNTKVDVEYEQVEQSEFGEKKIAEGVKVRDDAPEAPPPKQGARRPPRRAAA